MFHRIGVDFKFETLFEFDTILKSGFLNLGNTCICIIYFSRVRKKCSCRPKKLRCIKLNNTVLNRITYFLCNAAF